MLFRFTPGPAIERGPHAGDSPVVPEYNPVGPVVLLLMGWAPFADRALRLHESRYPPLLDTAMLPDSAWVLALGGGLVWDPRLPTNAWLNQAAGRPVVLVTSASHMPRAVRLFERRGLTVIPAPTGYLAPEREWSVRRMIPSPGNARKVEAAVYEWGARLRLACGRWPAVPHRGASTTPQTSHFPGPIPR